jgi:hypothetical protein
VASDVIAGVWVPGWASDGSVVGLRASSTTMPETVPTVASSAWRNGCFFLMGCSAHQEYRMSRACHQNPKNSWWMRRYGTPASRSAAYDSSADLHRYTRDG